MKKSKRLNHYIRLACLTGALFCYSASAFAEVLPNIQLPENGEWIGGGGAGYSINKNDQNHTMTITQGAKDAVIKWGKFSIGSIASVEFKGEKGFNVLNYDAGGQMSQIRGTLKAENGNVFIVNPAGVFIGNSAQVDVGSLYVSNKKLDVNKLDKFDGTADSIINNMLADQPATPAELMSLGHINASNVTFEGSRIVLDTELLTTGGLEHPMEAKNIHIKTDDSNKVVIGYDAYNSVEKSYNKDERKLSDLVDLTAVKGPNAANVKGYMWVRDLEQLQAMNTNKSGNYALRNGIGAISTKTGNFTPIGTEGDAFKGKFDGLAGNVDGIDFAIFDLHVTGAENQNNLGLFGVTEGAQIRNVLLTGGEVTGTGSNIGALVGLAKNTTIENVRNSINVSGNGTADTPSQNVGGIVGKVEDAADKHATTISDILNTGDIKGFANVGGVVGSIAGNTTGAHAEINGAENIGRVQGIDTIDTTNEDNTTYSHDIGGIAGSAKYADISNVENNLKVEGGYNVGGIVGSGESVKITDAVNSADITATGYKKGEYQYTTEVDFIRTDTKYDENNHTYYQEDVYQKNVHEKKLNVNVANVGGIAGSISGNSQLDTITNEGGDISTKFTPSETYGKYYHAGNVGGIVGSAVGTDANNTVTITNAENKENTVFGAHNVGGVAGYLENGTITLSSNNGGEITGTGARTSESNHIDEDKIIDYADHFAYESIRYRNNESFLIGNMGGIVGYMYGDNAFVSQSGNRGNVHSQKIDDGNITLTAKAANVGGIVGRINRDTNRNLTDIIANESTAAVYDCYNRGDIQGYTGVGGVIGLMYKGAVAASDNSGTIRATRQSSTAGGSVEALNMGGIVGDTTEEGEARAVIYDVHNDGVIGSEQLTDYYGRHVGGVVGRLSGEVEKSYNTGAIYNGYNVVGGVAGYMAAGSIKNSFNTGNITVYNQNNAISQVGGIVGGVDVYNQIGISNVYNLGTLRSFKGTNTGAGDNAVGGIVGGIFNWTTEQNESITISNVYTLGNLYSYAGGTSETDTIGAIVSKNQAVTPSISNAYYIKPQVAVSGNNGFRTLTGDNLNGAKSIEYAKRTDWDQYINFVFSDASLVDDTTFNSEGAWRIYNYEAPDKNKITTTPILNAFMPKSSNYFGTNSATGKTNRTNIHSVQYGTAYNPLLTIINARKPEDATGLLNGLNTISFDWNDINPDRSASFAVFNGNLSISDFNTQGNLYGGTLYAKGNLSINNAYSETEVDGKKYINSGDVLLGSGAKLYGSTINITSGTVEDGTTTLTNGGKLVNYGTIRSTGQVGESSNITLQAEGNVEIIGKVTSNSETNVVVLNVGRYPTDPGNVLAGQIIANIADKDKAMPSVGDYYSRSFTSASQSGDVTITSQNGDVSVLLGVAEKGVINASNNLTITGQNVYVDSDLSIKGNFTINANDTVLDLSNIAKNRLVAGETPDQKRIEFLQHFTGTGEGKGTLNFKKFDGTSITDNEDNAKIMFDLWNDDAPGGSSFELGSNVHKGLRDALIAAKVFDRSYVWVSNAKQLQGINGDKNNFTYNFALKNNIDAAEVDAFEAIGTGHTGNAGVYAGKFNGRGNTIVGLSVDNEASAGLFSVIDTDGEVSNLNIYSSHFTGGTVGAVAGINKGTIDNVTTFGNRVESNSTVNADAIAGIPDGHHGVLSSAGGITGINNGTISNAATNDAVATSVEDTATGHAFAGGIAGVNTANGDDPNKAAKITDSVANSDITSTKGAHALGGVVGINSKNAVVDTVRSLGIVNGTYSVAGDAISNNVGGIAGINEGGAQITKAYNVAHVSGGSNVGGIVGSLVGSDKFKEYDLQEVVSAGDITSQGNNVGGIVGNIDKGTGTRTYINSGRNTGEVTGVTNVGGIVGENGEGSNMTNIINDANATIKGDNNVGGLAGTNAGAIVASDMGLVNDGRVYGVTNVGGIAGVNTGTIKNTNSNITLYVKDNAANAQYFGGVAGRNEGTITNATNTGSVLAKGASYVGGITGENIENGHITGAGNSNSGKVVGAKFVGGVAGLNAGSVSGTDSGSGATTIENQGIVIATHNGAGGVFGENRTNITNAVLKNSGIVVGTTPDGTGGIIGLNSGKIEKSDLINTVDGLVVGKDNVGGLIGINKGTIAGGRDASDSYYAHQVYNNGTVIGGKGSDVEQNGWESKTITDADGNKSTVWYQVDKTTVHENGVVGSYNIGGLIGSNGFQNAGGTIETGSLTAGYNTGVVNGGINVGGVVGNNAGSVDQVFNASKNVTGATGKVVGKVVGYNDNNGTIKNAYDTVLGITDNDDTKVIGGGTKVITEEPEKWTTYGGGNDYGTNKLLSVFLTKINFVPKDANAFKDFVYNAHKQSIIVKAEKTSDGQDIVNVYKNDGLGNTNSETLLGHFVNASNNLGDDANAAHSLADFINTQITTGDDKGTGDLLSGTSFTDAGTYNIFNTKQIDVKGNNGSPNNLGFDVTDIKADNNTPIDKVEVNKAQISLTLDEIWRIYGDATIDNKTAEAFNHIFGDNGTEDYGFTINGNNVSINQELVDQLMSGVLKVRTITDVAVDNLDEGKTTNNVGTYDWSLKATLNSKNLASNNFELVSGDNTTFNGEYTGKDKSHVTKAALTFTVNDKEMTAGGSKPFFDGSYEGLANGDTLDTIKFGGYDLDSTRADTNTVGTYADSIGVMIGGTLYFAVSDILDNYNLVIDPGDLTVNSKKPIDPNDPTNPDNPYSPDNPNNWQAEDKYPWYQWDKQRNERERKAEVHFVDGGMHVEA